MALLGVAALVANACGPDAHRPEADHRTRGARGAPTVSRLRCGEQLTCQVGEVARCWGANELLQPAAGRSTGDGFALDGAVEDVAIGRHHACLMFDGRVSCWGSSLNGQLGVGGGADRCIDRPCSRSLVPVEGLPEVVGVAAGGFHTCALTASGEVWCWGANQLGQLGRAAGSEPGAPARVEGLDSVVSLAAGLLHTCAVRSDGEVWCWGDAGDGRLGLGGKGESAVEMCDAPVRVNGLGGAASAITAGAEHTCVLLGDGTVACWGANRFGQLGDGTTTSRDAPAAVQGFDRRVVALEAGDHFTCALLERGSVACWGWNDVGQLGLGSFDGPDEPEGFSAALVATTMSLPAGLSGPVRSIAAGPGHACLLAGPAGDEPWCWGRNEAGQLGDGSRVDRSAAVRSVRSTGEAADLPVARSKAAGESRRGVDVSYHTGRLDWTAIQGGGFELALTLSTAGVDFQDPMFYSHWHRTQSLIRGAYHFYVAHDDPEAQARWFIANTPLGSGDLLPVVDIESMGTDPPEDLNERLQTFVELLHQHYGARPIVYTGPDFWDANVGPGYGSHPLWVAEYGVDQPRIPVGWESWTLWQYQGDAVIAGAERPVDLDLLVSESELERLRIP